MFDQLISFIPFWFDFAWSTKFKVFPFKGETLPPLCLWWPLNPGDCYPHHDGDTGGHCWAGVSENVLNENLESKTDALWRPGEMGLLPMPAPLWPIGMTTPNEQATPAWDFGCLLTIPALVINHAFEMCVPWKLTATQQRRSFRLFSYNKLELYL